MADILRDPANYGQNVAVTIATLTAPQIAALSPENQLRYKHLTPGAEIIVSYSRAWELQNAGLLVPISVGTWPRWDMDAAGGSLPTFGMDGAGDELQPIRS